MNPPSAAAGRLTHGGDPADAAALGAEIWLDLSTGINPHSYPATFAAAAGRALPQRADAARLEAAARAAYRVPADAALVAAPGTQAILQWLPHLVPAGRVAVLGPTYEEHAACWRRTAEVTVHTGFDPEAAPLWVVVNPNNPDGRRLDPGALAAWADAIANGPGRALAERGDPVLVVDEAFMDLTPEGTVAGAPQTLVLRSFGKFYGLAGLRLGFAVGAPAMVARLAEALGPWAVGGPALHAGAAALADLPWAETMRRRLADERMALDAMLRAVGLDVVGGTDLFRLVESDAAEAWHQELAAAGIWTRRFPAAPRQLRFGLPGTAGPRLARILTAIADRL